MSLARKLQIPVGQNVCVLNAPPGVALDLRTRDDPKAGPVLVFVRNLAELHRFGAPFAQAAREDRLAWIAYPKAGQLGTDLNRDILWETLKAEKIRPVRNISIDDVWSALRFRPG